MTVLPDDAVRARVDDDHPVVEVVVDEEIAVRERQRERGMVELRRTCARPVAPMEVAVAIEGLEDAGTLPADRDVKARPDLVRVGRVIDVGRVGRPEDMAG